MSACAFDMLVCYIKFLFFFIFLGGFGGGLVPFVEYLAKLMNKHKA